MKKEVFHYIEGDTFKYKEKLKSMGCKWDSEKKMWCTTDVFLAGRASVLVSDRLKDIRRSVDRRNKK